MGEDIAVHLAADDNLSRHEVGLYFARFLDHDAVFALHASGNGALDAYGALRRDLAPDNRPGADNADDFVLVVALLGLA